MRLDIFAESRPQMEAGQFWELVRKPRDFEIPLSDQFSESERKDRADLQPLQQVKTGGKRKLAVKQYWVEARLPN